MATLGSLVTKYVKLLLAVGYLCVNLEIPLELMTRAKVHRGGLLTITHTHGSLVV